MLCKDKSYTVLLFQALYKLTLLWRILQKVLCIFKRNFVLLIQSLIGLQWIWEGAERKLQILQDKGIVFADIFHCFYQFDS